MSRNLQIFSGKANNRKFHTLKNTLCCFPVCAVVKSGVKRAGVNGGRQELLVGGIRDDIQRADKINEGITNL